jgi:hypothetical protein
MNLFGNRRQPPDLSLAHTLREGKHMERYKNLAGDSSVLAYENGSGFIRVQFRDGHIYRYTTASAGPTNIAFMKHLATLGRGLNTFINATVRKRYAQRER